ncbi:MAG: hypothetical protein AAF393_13255 [Pseudomonadota bacterium]
MSALTPDRKTLWAIRLAEAYFYCKISVQGKGISDRLIRRGDGHQTLDAVLEITSSDVG